MCISRGLCQRWLLLDLLDGANAPTNQGPDDEARVNFEAIGFICEADRSRTNAPSLLPARITSMDKVELGAATTFDRLGNR